MPSCCSTQATESEIEVSGRTMSRRTPPPRWLLHAALAIGLAGSIWSLLGGESCAQCGEAARVAGPLNLAAAGVTGYGLLLIFALRSPDAPVLPAGLFVAAGVHLALVGSLIAHRILCPPCLLVAAGAWSGAGLVLRERPHLARQGALLALAAAALV